MLYARFVLLYREVRVKKTPCSMNRKNANYIRVNRDTVAASQNLTQYIRRMWGYALRVIHAWFVRGDMLNTWFVVFCVLCVLCGPRGIATCAHTA